MSFYAFGKYVLKENSSEIDMVDDYESKWLCTVDLTQKTKKRVKIGRQ